MDLSVLQNFAETLKSKFALPGRASPEDQLKPCVANLLGEAGKSIGQKVDSRTETHLSDHKVRPDIAIYVNGLICGYVELKQPGLGADAPRLKGDHNKRQWEKLKGLPNLIYTDGREWALYRTGEPAEGQPIVRLHDDPTEKGKDATTKDDVEALERLFRDFLTWEPAVPHSPTGLAKYLAPLSRFLRSEVENALGQSGSAVELLANEWRQFFFPDADNAKFADAYAQTVTYAMLLARLSGAAKLDPAEAAKTLDKNNGLLARTLELLGQQAARDELAVGFEMLQRSLEALNPHDFLKSKPDLWLYFYEDFLAAYDPKLRKDFGVYYTPREVVELQIRLASELLEKRFGKKLGFADDGVVFLDPAVGTGTYPVAAVKNGLDKVRARSGPGAVPPRARQMAENMHGFEVLVGPYAVAHLRLTQALEGAMNQGRAASEPEEKLAKRLNIYLADTLSSPNRAPPGGLDLTHKALTQEHEAARKVKQGGDILVCLGNPPYDRQRIDDSSPEEERKGGWVRFGDQIKGGANQTNQGERPIFDDFLEPARAAGYGVYLQAMYNDYLYFWRWALWRMFERQNAGGIVTFITASSFIAGPGFVGVREVMRKAFDEIWVVDLGGDNLGTRKTPNVFNIQTPVAITIGVRGKTANPAIPAKAHYARIDSDTREGKLSALDAVDQFSSLIWRDCPDDWKAPFLPVGKGDFFTWPKLEDVFPWHYNGTQWFRGWTVAPTEELLRQRVRELVGAKGALKKKLFKESAHRKISKRYASALPGGGDKPVDSLTEADVQNLNVTRFGWRSFDRAWALVDARFGDRLRQPLWETLSERQVFFTSLMAVPLASGPAMQSTIFLPDCHVVRGSYGGRDIFPLYRDTAGTDPNVTSGLLAALGEKFGAAPSAEDLAAYVYAVLGGQSFTQRFWNELETPGPRIPLTKDGAIFAEAVKLGRKLIWLHTYAERFRDEERGDEIPSGAAKIIKGVSDNPEKYPEKYNYDEENHEIVVGDGRFGPIAPNVWEFEVSGLKIVQSWLGYRMKKRAGRKSSPLDDISPERWTARMSDEFLELLWVLEATLAMEPELSAVLDKVITGACFLATELPSPKPEQRLSPASIHGGGDLLALMEDEKVDEDEDGFGEGQVES